MKIENYQQALQELQAIVAKIEANEVNIDELSIQMKRAATLIEYCQKKLRGTEVEMEQLFGKERDG